MSLARSRPGSASPASLLQLQRTVGNAAFAAMLRGVPVQRDTTGGVCIEGDTDSGVCTSEGEEPNMTPAESDYDAGLRLGQLGQPNVGSRTGKALEEFRAGAIQGAVTALHATGGWPKLAADVQSALDRLIGAGATDLSTMARKQFWALLPELAVEVDVDQATTLTGLLSVRPDVVAEHVASAVVGYQVADPVVKKDYAFRGRTADAESRLIAYDDGPTVELVSPKAPTPGLHNHTIQETEQASSHVPKAARALMKTILLNVNTNPDDPYWAVQYKDDAFHSYMTAGAEGIVTIYPDKTEKPVMTEDYEAGSMVHETGHTWSYQKWGQDTTKGGWVEWQKAMDADKLSVSDYATKAIAEDVAETIQIYGTLKGTPRFDAYRKMVPNRFKILDAQYGSGS